MATSPNSRLHNRKRQHTEAALSQDNPPSLPSKRFKSTREPYPSSNLPPPAFWDNLSKIWLTRQAVKELDRRNAQSNRSPTQYKVRKPRTRSADRKLKQKAQAAVPVSEYLLRAPQADITLLKSFARQGGPDITDLRGVCTISYHWPAPIANISVLPVSPAYNEFEFVRFKTAEVNGSQFSD